MKFQTGMAAVVASSALIMATPVFSQDWDAQIDTLVATCNAAPSDCAGAIQAFNLRVSAAPAPVLSVEQLGRIYEAVSVASIAVESAPPEQRTNIRRQLAQSLNSAAQRTSSPPPAVVASINSAVTDLAFGRATGEAALEPEAISPG